MLGEIFLANSFRTRHPPVRRVNHDAPNLELPGIGRVPAHLEDDASRLPNHIY
jgi:hypothetical protein